MSAILPNGRRKTVADKRYEVEIQVNKTASVENSLPIEGRAIFVEDPIKGVRKEVIVTTIITAFLLTPFCIIFFKLLILFDFSFFNDLLTVTLF